MFKCSIKGKRLKEATTGLTAMVDEIRLNLSSIGISVKAVDPANVAMVSLTLGKEAFESFNTTDSLLGIDLTRLSSFIEMVDNDDTVSLELDELTHKLKIEFRGLTYTMSLLDPKTIRTEPKSPTLELPIELAISGTDFKFGMKAASKISDYVIFGVNKEATNFFIAASEATEDIIYEIPIERTKVTRISEAKSTFSIDYLIKIQKQAEKTSELTILLGKDYPVKIGFPISDGNGVIEYMIAPRVENED